ncbi:hypothetical protein K4K51_013213 [Colletotrichum sp. SAR 10_75]|nr:hypothetical protein K4K51_013213 [Colletotrichum sp. SAR 10_75]
MAMRQPDPEIDDVPPPPYSETDIYSTAGRSSNTNNTNASASPRIPSDDAASRVSSHASSHSEVIYTPPLTPRTNTTQPHSRHDSSLSSANASSSNHPASSTTAYSDFSAAYFDSRPPLPSRSPREQLVHTITVTPTTTPDDVPYAPTWAARDVTQQDWATFINVLIPHHAAARNEAVINRKLQAEEEALAAAAAAANSSGDSPYVGHQWHPAAAQPPIFPPGPFPQGPHAPPPGPPPDHPLFQAHRGGAHTRGRGRPPGRYPANQHRSPSSDSSSSASSTSSSDSASSVGSLPDYDDLYPSQLPIYKQRVADWLAHPDQPVTRAEVSQLRSEIRSARSSAREQASSATETPAVVDERALKAEIKALTQEWRKLKRQQRGVRREKRRERRAKRQRGAGVEPASPSTPQPPSSQSLFDAVKDMEKGLAQKVEELDKRLIEEIDEISRNVEKLRVEADAEYARELVAEEERKAAGW